MSVYKRGGVYWYEFQFGGQRIRETAKTGSKNVAVAAERARRRQLEEGFNRISRRDAIPLAKVAVAQWIETKANLTEKTQLGYRQRVVPILKVFGPRLLSDIDLNSITSYQKLRQSQGVSGRTINFEIGCLRGVLRHFGLWARIADRVRHLKERHDVGKAITREDEAKLRAACEVSHSSALQVLFTLSIDTGLRSSEVKALRHKDLHVERMGGEITGGYLTVPKSKTQAGTGRLIPLSKRVCKSLSMWLSLFPQATPDSYVFPRHRVGFADNQGTTRMWGIELTEPMGEWKRAWQAACQRAGAKYRWHDLRHTFISRLAENPAVSEETIRSLAGHVSRGMLQRYSHIRTEAKTAAIRVLELSETIAAVNLEVGVN